MITWGIDGCRGGWLAVSVSGGACTYRYFALGDQDFWQLWETGDRLLIDLPVGLSSTAAGRPCDRLLRQTLGRGYSSSVFTPPVRQALTAQTYPEACAINASICGKKLSKQTWFIMGRIRDVDIFLSQNPAAATKTYESHPERLFQRLHGGTLPHKKKTVPGQSLRSALLRQVLGADAIALAARIRAAHPQKVLANDDIWDAIALAYFADLEPQTPLPNPPDVDERGLRMAFF
ncbi:MAG: DUF429 domain-containing protein [Oscillatoriales cyanobacterium SM2_2_1]|nr:DUF429 domain-containing protein [Oscillatoriales cyanobacterium SM2_2_1]